ncbi:unnamed protein product [Phytophthora fragariaefolia]|uniref:Protein FAM221A n=1 Tax=Phytophthora fragariaefolia TaxID=1490495 RepID=A0A9W6X9L2_9STRA|nr:unnamed protein product [Phytophthora fragariaefolia]
MEQSLSARAQSLQLLKSKLRTSGRRRSKPSRVAATLEDLTPNQREEAKLSQQLVRRQSGQHLHAPKVSKPQAVEGTHEPAAATSTNQDDVSVAELKKEFSEIMRTSTVHLPEDLVALSGATPAPFSVKLKSYTKTVIQWTCDTCKRECIPVREESRCLWYFDMLPRRFAIRKKLTRSFTAGLFSGHRYKEHPSSAEDPRVKSPVGFRAFACTSSRCSCRAFFYIVAEGAWILRCRCKHKHTDHDPGAKPFVCKKPKCGCSGFDR